MSELDDLTKKLSEYAGRKDEHSLLPRVLLALVKSGSRSEQEIAKLADKLAKELEKIKIPAKYDLGWAYRRAYPRDGDSYYSRDSHDPAIGKHDAIHPFGNYSSAQGTSASTIGEQ